QYGQNDGYLRAWKIYTPWGDVPNTSGWWLDDSFGLKFIQHVKDLSDTYGMPPLICAHKGFALPSFDQEKAATRDVGVVAPMFWDLASNTGVIFIIYHSGYDGDGVGLGGPLNQGTSANGPYPGETAAPSTSRGVDNFITALRENGWSARHCAPGGSPATPLAAGEAPPDAAHANVPNVYAELGSVWGSVVGNPTRGSWLLGKLIYYVGPKQVVWGTDALWGGSPQGLIEALRAFQMSDEARATYNLPWGLDGDVDDPTQLAIDPRRSIRNGILGRSAAEPYRIDPDRSEERRVGKESRAGRRPDQAEDGIRDRTVTGVQTCALPISGADRSPARLPDVGRGQGHVQPAVGPRRRRRRSDPARDRPEEEHPQRHPRAERRRAVPDRSGQIGRASCRERE